jgi:hypothetical protein
MLVSNPVFQATDALPVAGFSSFPSKVGSRGISTPNPIDTVKVADISTIKMPVGTPDGWTAASGIRLPVPQTLFR